MNGLIRVIIAGCIGMSFVTISNAANDKMMNANSKKWTCETNASSSSNEADKKADENMKKMTTVKAAFDYALKHCRDCTKITCSMENNQ